MVEVTSHYLNQCWPRPLAPCGVSRPHWVNPCRAEVSLWNIQYILICVLYNSAPWNCAGMHCVWHFLVVNKSTLMLQYQYHSYWWLGSLSRQGIRDYDIGMVLPEYSVWRNNKSISWWMVSLVNCFVFNCCLYMDWFMWWYWYHIYVIFCAMKVWE